MAREGDEADAERAPPDDRIAWRSAGSRNLQASSVLRLERIAATRVGVVQRQRQHEVIDGKRERRDRDPRGGGDGHMPDDRADQHGPDRDPSASVSVRSVGVRDG